MAPLYLAFPDGVFHYVCAECDARCCRGFGFWGSLQREMGTLLTLYPAMESMATQRRGSVIHFLTLPGGCVFLESDNRCRIEKTHGKSLKPGVCGLFPFNLFTRIGDTIAVSPHFLCPLRLQVPARPGHIEGTHALIEPAVRESGLLDPAYLDARHSLHASADAPAVVEREIGFRDRCAAALGQGRFRETLREAAPDPGRLEGWIARAAALMGLTVSEPLPARDAVDDVLLALAAPLRLSLLDLSSEGILLALALGEIVVRRVITLSEVPLTPQGAHRILTSTRPALRLLARADEPLDRPELAGTDFPRLGSPAMTLAGYLALRAGNPAAGTLDLLEGAMRDLTSAADRMAFLTDLGAYLERARRHREASSAGAG